MRGIYRFYRNGRLLGESVNVITDEGKRHIRRYLAGQVPTLAGSIAIGAGHTPAQSSDQRLTYEFNRATIYLSSPDHINNKIIFKGTLEDVVSGSIHEVGLYSTPLTPSSWLTLASFERAYEDWSNGNFASGNERIGIESLRLSPSASGTLSSSLPGVNLDLSNYTSSDLISMAFYANSHVSSVSFRLRGVDQNAYYQFTTSPSEGYNVVSFNKGQFVKDGIVDYAFIDSLELVVNSKSSGSGLVDFDGIQIRSTASDIDNVLISRSVLPSPVVKDDTSDMDIEYSLEVSL